MCVAEADYSEVLVVEAEGSVDAGDLLELGDDYVGGGAASGSAAVG